MEDREILALFRQRDQGAIPALEERYGARLRALAAAEGMYLTGRYSPGYGDWPIGVQPRIAALLDTPRRIGLCVTGTCLMLPRKSITAALGLSRTPVTGRRAGCAHCALRDKCEYRKRGETCES